MHFIPEAEFGIRKKRCSDAVLEIQHLDGRDREVASLRPAWVTQQQKEEEKEPEEEEEEEKEKEKSPSQVQVQPTQVCRDFNGLDPVPLKPRTG